MTLRQIMLHCSGYLSDYFLQLRRFLCGVSRITYERGQNHLVLLYRFVLPVSILVHGYVRLYARHEQMRVGSLP
jgi:hypothetical protein